MSVGRMNSNNLATPKKREKNRNYIVIPEENNQRQGEKT